MRRKSTRNAQKATPDKLAKETETPPKTRRSRRRKRTPSKSTDSEEEVAVVSRNEAVKETPDTTTKSHTPTDEETSEEPIWKVTSTDDAPKGEIQKLKICLTRPSPDSPDKSKTRRSKSNSQTEDETTSSEDKSTRRTRSQGSPNIRNDGISSQEGDEDVEDKKGKGKSKGKHKSKIEKSPHLSEPELQTNNEISENAQVTPQSPSIDKPVDNENDRKVAETDVQNVTESVPERDNVEETVSNLGHDSGNVQDTTDVPENKKESQDVSQNKESDDDDEPLSVILKNVNEKLTEKPKSADEVLETEIEHAETEVENPKTEVENPKTEVKHPETEVEHPKTEVEHPETEIERPETEVEPPKTIIEPPETTIEPQVQIECSKDQEQMEISLEIPNEIPEDNTVQPIHEENIVQSDDKADETVLKEVERQESTEESTKLSAEDSDMKHAEQPQTESLPENSSETLPQQTIAEEKVTENNSTESNEIIEAETSGENIFTIATEEKEIVKERAPRRRLKRNIECITSSAEEKEESESSPLKPSKIKRKWENDSRKTSSLVKLDLDSIQTVWPKIDFPEEPDLHLEAEKERRKSITDSSGKKLERKVSVEYKSDFSERPSFEKQTSVSSATNDSEDNSNIIAFNRKISIVDDTASKLKPPPSPAKNPISSILFITNLVRPFTVKQLKELLERTGKIQDEGFWTDRIKSKCYVQYETQEEAEATRNALHGVQWPIGNGKKLIIDFANEEDMQNAKNPPAPPPAAPVPELKVAVKENLEPVENKPRQEETISKEVEKKKPEGPVREWDIGKKDVRRDRSRSRERSRKHRRSPSPREDFMSRKQRKMEESVPQKLMDDLFLKTKATPSIYWQPLSPEEISMKQQQRLIRMEEHKRRMEETSRMKGREMGRGAFRRRYD